jgi:hypothetical protein
VVFVEAGGGGQCSSFCRKFRNNAFFCWPKKGFFSEDFGWFPDLLQLALLL